MLAIILLSALWLYPFFSFILLWRTREDILLRKRIIFIALIITALTIIGFQTDIATTISALNWLLFTGIYFTFCLLLWLTVFIKNRMLKIAGLIFTGLVYGMIYFITFMGSLGIAMALDEMAPRKEQWLTGRLIYHEIRIGDVFSSKRGKRIEIYRTSPWLPLVKWRILTKEYHNPVAYPGTFEVDYRKKEKTLYLHTDGLADTLKVEK